MRSSWSCLAIRPSRSATRVFRPVEADESCDDGGAGAGDGAFFFPKIRFIFPSFERVAVVRFYLVLG